jgi:indolepyruvate ferredoxin oxidoreductase alpha subunit
MHEQEKVTKRWPAAVKFIKDNKINEFFADGTQDFGIVMQGGLYNTVIRSLQLLGLSDIYGNSKIPLYILNVTYPIVDDEVVEFAKSKKGILLVEEGQPDYIEQNINSILRRAGVHTALHGKD